MKNKQDIQERFWGKVQKASPEECWIWRGGSWGGYSTFAESRTKSRRAHRYAWIFTFGDIPTGADVKHSCNNSMCVNPNHLYLTAGDDPFWIKVKKIDNECWNWQGAKLKSGYGIYGNHGNNYLAHRYSWLIHHGEIPSKMLVCHTCDNPTCVNPDHLFLGTPKDNVQDMWDKHRGIYGDNSHYAKLTTKTVEAILQAYSTGIYTRKEIGNMFGVKRANLGLILTRKTWKHISIS